MNFWNAPRAATKAFVLCAALALAAAASAQGKGTPGKFDFYLMNQSWSPEFCAIQGTGPECAQARGFVMHGLWPQNFDGSYPAFCSNAPAPADLSKNLDITPDISLLQHEWAKHGTCSGVGGDPFFAMEHTAFNSLKTPPALIGLTHEISLTPNQVLADFYAANPRFVKGSLVLSCGNNYLTAVEACLSKNGLQPIVCQGLHGCGATSIKIEAPGTTAVSLAPAGTGMQRVRLLTFDRPFVLEGPTALFEVGGLRILRDQATVQGHRRLDRML